jgi:phosphatidate cytidylyltransferase
VLHERIFSAVVFGIPFVAVAILGGTVFNLLILVVLCIGSMEFMQLVARRGHRPFAGLMLLWTAYYVLERLLPPTKYVSAGAAVLLLLTLIVALVRFRFAAGSADVVTGFAMTLAGSFYIGWSGAHLVSLRALDDGLYWVTTIVGVVWIAEAAAYFIGTAVGRTPFSPEISPSKTWEGYLGGVLCGTGGAVGLTLLWGRLGAGPASNLVHGLVLGLLASTLGPLGDLGISMIKRYAGAKHASNLIPGHGGILDRLDSLIVTILLGYYYVTLFAL